MFSCAGDTRSHTRVASHAICPGSCSVACWALVHGLLVWPAASQTKLDIPPGRAGLCIFAQDVHLPKFTM